MSTIYHEGDKKQVIGLSERQEVPAGVEFCSLCTRDVPVILQLPRTEISPLSNYSVMPEETKQEAQSNS